jgi:hypothetical protein
MDLKLFVLRAGQRSELWPNFHSTNTDIFGFLLNEEQRVESDEKG